MAKILDQMMTAEIDGDFVVFLIGIRINKLWKIWKWIPVFRSMPRMLIELGKNPDLGLLHARTHFGIRNTMVVQYWRSFDHLHNYSIDKTRAHLPAWQQFHKSISTNGDVGIWHETYLIRAGEYENVYGNMPAYGLGLAGELKEAKGQRRNARGRLSSTASSSGEPHT